MTNDTKMDLRSMDIADEQKARLKQLFPEVFNEDKIDFDKLKLALGEDVDTGRERFGMNWPGKAQAIRVAQEPSMATLKPDRDASVDFDTTENLFIEGDNLEVLKLLQKSYFGKIKMIYIDPPYNTGKEFIYPDKYAEGLDTYLQYTGQLDAEGKKFTTNTETDGRYHSKWMNMMWPRLFLARNLLTDDGVIFISIDDHELDNLKKLCNEVFGEDNFKVQIIIENDSRARQYDVVATTHEYMLVYSKSSEHAFKELVNQEKTFKYNDNEGGFDLYELRNRNIIFNSKNRPNLRYPFWVNPNKKDDNNLYEVSLDEVDGWAITFPQESQGVETVWRWGRDKAIKNVNKILFARLTEKGVFQIVKKYRGQNYTLNSVWSEKEIKTDKGTLELKKLFGGKIFDFPKPTNLIKKIIQLISDEDAYVLDFFSGSGTTAHAVMLLNAEDGGNRKFIMSQLPEATDEKSEAHKSGYRNIAEVGKERIRRAGKQITKESVDREGFDANSFDKGFKVYKLDKSNFIVWDGKDATDLQPKLELSVKNINSGSGQDDLLAELLLKSGFALTSKIDIKTINDKKVYLIADGSLIVCLENEIDKDLAKAIADLKPTKVICLNSGFKSDADLTNAAQIMKIKEIEFRTV